MSLLLLKILVICTSLLAWAVLSIAGISLLQYCRYNKKFIFATFIAWLLSFVSFYNCWYEGLFHFEKIALLSSLNSWAFTLLTPLFYLHFRYRITKLLPDIQQWRRHLLIPGILAGVYIGMTLLTPISDKLIYSWNELVSNISAWWVFFRVGCYLLLVLQLYVYLPRIMICLNNMKGLHIQIIRKELLEIMCFYIISIICMFTSCYIYNILYNISLFFIGVYLLKQTVFYYTIKRKMGFYLIPHIFIKAETKQIKKNEVAIPQLIKEKEDEEEVISLLKSPQYLHNPNLTLKLLARELGMNATSLSQYFSQHIGIRFPDYVMTLRLNEAEELLINTDMKVIEISEFVGFQNASTFYLAFNTRHHMPPLQWRKKMKNIS